MARYMKWLCLNALILVIDSLSFWMVLQIFQNKLQLISIMKHNMQMGLKVLVVIITLRNISMKLLPLIITSDRQNNNKLCRDNNMK
jgi:hypothetical protein